MLLALIFGILIGSVTVVFAIENTQPVTVSLLGWHATAPSAFVLIFAVVVGMLIAALMMLPRAIRASLDSYYARRAELRARRDAQRQAVATTT